MTISINAETIRKRQEKLGAAMARVGLDAVVLNAGPSLTYMTGLHFHLSERPVVACFTPGANPALVLPALEATKLEGLPYALQAFTYGEEPSTWAAAFGDGMQAAGIKGGRIGAEARGLRLLELSILEEVLPHAEFIPAEEVIGSLRVIKDADEVAAMREAVRIAQRALEETLPAIKAGMSEREVAAELTLQLFRQGSDAEIPFSPIVASGAHNSANPHAVPGDRKLAAGDLLVIDWGASYRGYLSDITRTFAVGEVSEELRRIHQITQEANAAGRAAVTPGVSCGAVDRACRQVIEQAGYGECFIHRTGHGLGMESHEEPYIRGDNQSLLEAGMTFTIEPGIYIPGLGGVRVEDDVLVTNEGIESLTDLPRQLISIG